MPTITLQVGQCGNQVGQLLFQRLAAQAAAPGSDLATASEFFRHSPCGRRAARCLLVDTEPKVVNSVLVADRQGVFSRQQCFLGQSGRGNNWAFGYSQLNPTSNPTPSPLPDPIRRPGTAIGPAWVSSTATEDPSQLEFRILDQVYDGIRRETEEADGCPSFLLLHSLAGGSGSGMGSRILEHLRANYPLSYIAAASVAPRAAGDTPMQSLNAVMSLSFLQAYADTVLLFSNQDLLDACQRPSVTALLPEGGPSGGSGGGGLADVNRLVTHNLTACLWPLNGAEVLGGGGRVRDMVSTVAADPCMKVMETWTVPTRHGVPVSGLWVDALRGLGSLMPRADVTRCNAPISTAGAMLLARGFPTSSIPPILPNTTIGPIPTSTTSAPSATSLLDTYMRSLGPHGAAPTLAPEASLWLRSSPTSLLLRETPQRPTTASASTSAGHPPTGAGPPSGATKGAAGGAAPSLTTVANRSSVVGFLEGTVQRALAVCDAGAYLHWYARHGCSGEAVREAAGTLLDVAACYRQLHGIPYDD